MVVLNCFLGVFPSCTMCNQNHNALALKSLWCLRWLTEAEKQYTETHPAFAICCVWSSCSFTTLGIQNTQHKTKRMKSRAFLWSVSYTYKNIVLHHTIHYKQVEKSRAFQSRTRSRWHFDDISHQQRRAKRMWDVCICGLVCRSYASGATCVYSVYIV